MSKRIKDLRAARGWSGRELAEECQRIGSGITDNVIENIEGRRRRRDVTVDELLALAAALDVPPLLLLMPEDSEVAITPELSIDPMKLVMWVNGIQAAAGLPKVRFTRSAAPIALYHAANEAIEAAKNADRMWRAARGTDEEVPARERRDERLRRMADTIRPVLLAGLLPANLPFAWITEAVDRGWLDSNAVPWDQVEAAQAKLED